MFALSCSSLSCFSKINLLVSNPAVQERFSTGIVLELNLIHAAVNSMKILLHFNYDELNINGTCRVLFKITM